MFRSAPSRSRPMSRAEGYEAGDYSSAIGSPRVLGKAVVFREIANGSDRPHRDFE